MTWKKISVLLLFAVAFLNGAMMGQNYEMSMSVWLVCSILIAAILGGSKITKSLKENGGIRKVITAILIGLVLIPLVFLGTCLLGFGGTSIGGLFRR